MDLWLSKPKDNVEDSSLYVEQNAKEAFKKKEKKIQTYMKHKIQCRQNIQSQRQKRDKKVIQEGIERKNLQVEGRHECFWPTEYAAKRPHWKCFNKFLENQK